MGKIDLVRNELRFQKHIWLINKWKHWLLDSKKLKLVSYIYRNLIKDRDWFVMEMWL